MNAVFMCLFGFFAAGANAGTAEKLVGALEAEIGEFPYQVSLRIQGSHFCGGALITKKHVLTAAHCIYPIAIHPYFRKAMTVVAGTNSIKSGGKSYAVAALSYYEKYVNRVENPDFMNDIGIVTLAEEVEASKLIRIIRLPTKDVEGTEQAVTTGWGSTKTPESPLSVSLKKLKVNVVDNAICQLYYLGEVSIDESQICTYGKPAAGTCLGDSGGPLVHDDEIVGVVSGGTACAKGYPDIFTRVAYYLNYIHGIIGGSKEQ